MDNLINCPSCDTKLKGLIKKIRMLNDDEMAFIKTFYGYNGSSLYEKCGSGLLEETKEIYNAKRVHMKRKLQDYYQSFPVLTIQPPGNWTFESLGIVTAQTTKDSRVSNTSIIDALLGLNQNLVDLDYSANKGESVCFELLRQKTYALGGNAVVAVDIDYTEFGLKGELMLICMAGTAIKIDNLFEVNEKIQHARSNYEQDESMINEVLKFNNIAS